MMRVRDRNNLLKALVGAGMYLLDPVRDRLADRLEDWSEKAQEGYEEASGRLDRATRAIRGRDHSFVGTATAFLVGAGIGVGIGMLLAPASGEEIRNTVAEKVQDVSDKVRSQFSSERQQSSTGTYGQ